MCSTMRCLLASTRRFWRWQTTHGPQAYGEARARQGSNPTPSAILRSERYWFWTGDCKLKTAVSDCHREAIEFFHHERGQRAVNVRTRFLCIEAQLARVNAGTSSTHSNLQGCWGLPST
jgi:hypothetical protein